MFGRGSGLDPEKSPGTGVDPCAAGDTVAEGPDHTARPIAQRDAPVGLTKHLRAFAQRIRVNVVHPGWTDTPGERKFFSEDVLQKAGAALPWGRMARPEEIARGIVFLLDPASDYITGTTLAIDGGSQLPWWSRRGTGEF